MSEEKRTEWIKKLYRLRNEVVESFFYEPGCDPEAYEDFYRSMARFIRYLQSEETKNGMA